MRLTLRNLLAYLDGILDPADAEELGKKIEESEYAVKLVHRIRDVMRRLRLSAPSVTDRGPGLDPNTVAEYLDNALAGDRVTDFEKVCLDSDIHLAEVAACHQILTLVLGEPVEVDADTRQRMYRLKDAPAVMAQQPPVIPLTPALPAVAKPPVVDLEPGDGEPARRRPRPRPTVPEYLRDPPKRPWWLSAAVVVFSAACILGVLMVVLSLLGQLEHGTIAGNWLEEIGLKEPPEISDNSLGRPTGKAATASDKSEKSERKEPLPKPREGDVAPSASIPATQMPRANATKPAPTPPGAPELPRATTPPAKPPVAEPSRDTKAAPKAPEGQSKAGPKLPSEPPGPENVPRGGAEKTEPKTAPQSPGPPEPIARLLSNEQVLLCRDPVGGWGRVGPNQTLMPVSLLALPTYRAKVAFNAGVTLEILGGSRIELLGGGRQEQPGIRVAYGRVVLLPLALAAARLRLSFGDHAGTIQFIDPDSIVAIEVRRIRAPGTNPESPTRTTADLYVASGNVFWEAAAAGKAGPPLRLASPQRLSFDEPSNPMPADAKKLPEWITAEPIGYLDRLASPMIAQALPSGRPAPMGLLELTSRRQKEVRWLALRCLGYAGQFRDMVAVLNDPSRRLEWPDYIDELRRAIDRDQETAVTVRQAFEAQYPQQAADLYRMLWGYTNKDLEGGEDAKLVKGLENEESLPVRVLSFWNLKDITGAGLHYQPELPPARRAPPVRYWEQRLKAKEIRLKGGENKTKPVAEEKAVLPAAE